MANFDYCPLVWFFTSRSSISKLEKIQERALRFVLKDSVSCYDELISKAKVDAFRVSAVKKMATEVFKILNHISPGYFENYFQKTRNPYNLRNNNKLVQPMKLTTGSCHGGGSVVPGGPGVVAFTTYDAAGDGRVGAVAVPWFLCLCL